MAARLPAFLPRLAAIVLLGLALTATLTYAAGRNLNATPVPAAAAAPKAVPLVRRRRSKSSFRLREGRARGWRLCLARRRSGARLFLEHGRLAVAVPGIEDSRHRLPACDPHAQADERLRRDRPGRGRIVVRRDGCAVSELASTLGPAAPATSTAVATTMGRRRPSRRRRGLRLRSLRRPQRRPRRPTAPPRAGRNTGPRHSRSPAGTRSP